MFNSNIQIKNIISLNSLALSLVFFVLSPLSHAALPSLTPTYDTTELETQREQFLIAEKAIASGKLKQYQRLKNTLKDYPLYPYLQAAELKRRLNSASANEVKEFLDSYQDTPFTNKLYQTWMRSLARHGKFETMVENFRPTENVTQHCRFVHALIQTEQKEQAYALMSKLWLNGSSLPDTCNTPLKAWKDAGYLSTELLWGRIKLVMKKRNHRLATFLGKQLPAEERVWLSLWKKAQRNPEYIIDKIDRLDFIKRPVLHSIMADSIKRLAYRKPLLVAEYWQQLNSQHVFEKDEKEKIEHRLAKALAQLATPTSHQALKNLNIKNTNAEIAEPHIFSALQNNNWVTALAWLDNLDEEERNTERWLYWRARTLESMQRTDEANYLYQIISNSRNYYSFLAAERIGNNYKLTHRPLKNTESELLKLQQIPGIARAQELFLLKRKGVARSEWNYAIKKMKYEQLLIAAQVANQWDWKNRSITTLAKAKYWDEVVLRFPLTHRENVEGLANQKGVNPAWAFAVIRQESAFVTDARSSSGALGLMQLMPKTARYVARKIGIKRPRKNDLINSDINIKLGVNYLKKLKHDFDGNTVLATAAYNAGPTRVNSWLPKNDSNINTDLWIEMIPYNETRDYLKRVLTYTVIYERRLGIKNSPLFERMLMPTPEYTASIL